MDGALSSPKLCSKSPTSIWRKGVPPSSLPLAVRVEHGVSDVSVGARIDKGNVEEAESRACSGLLERIFPDMLVQAGLAPVVLVRLRKLVCQKGANTQKVESGRTRPLAHVDSIPSAPTYRLLAVLHGLQLDRAVPMPNIRRSEDELRRWLGHPHQPLGTVERHLVVLAKAWVDATVVVAHVHEDDVRLADVLGPPGVDSETAVVEILKDLKERAKADIARLVN